MEKKKAGIIGATGYAGAELLRLLLTHPDVEVAAISSVSYEGQEMAEVYRNFLGRLNMVLTDQDDVIAKSDVIFASLPHGLCEEIGAKCVEQGKILIDLGADFRLSKAEDYEKWYGLSYRRPELHEKAAYCIPELHRRRLTSSISIIGNPGCYPTSIALGLAPAAQAGKIVGNSVIIDSKSGVTGAGRGLTLGSHYPECNEAFSAYKVAAHRHTPEIEQTLSELLGEPAAVTFVPHLLPVNRGIISTIYATLTEEISAEAMHALYTDFYQDEPFVRVLPLGVSADIKNVKYSNYCDLSIFIDPRTHRLIVVSAIDNMVKGAAGQAIQNMNIRCGFAEDAGIRFIPPAF
ncbi:MAG TPA: N-acetyl-gamma-glutamyl-phosphate reductase [Firmicutes bacterium]|nr:N-acetyl-gamma-glutamyl-phosphate reductase [Bacillota bacterium]